MEKSKHIRVGILTNFHPYTFVHEDHIEGFAIDYILGLAHQYDLKITFIKFTSWSELLAAVDENKVDIIPNLEVTQSRKRRFVFSRPYEFTQIAGFTKFDAQPKKKLEDYSGDRVGILSHTGAEKVLYQHYYERIFQYQRINDLINDLLMEQIDIAIAPESVALRAVYQLNAEDRVHTAFHQIAAISNAMAVNIHNKELADYLIPKADDFAQTKKFDLIYMKWFTKPDLLIEYRPVIYTLLIVLPAVTILILFTGLFLRYRDSRRFTTMLEGKIRELTVTRNDLNRTNKNLENSNKELESFAYTVSHDLRAPLRHIAGFASMLEKELGENLTAKAVHYINTIKKSSAKLDNLIDELLKFSRLNQAVLNMELFDPENMLEEIIDEFSCEEYSNTKYTVQSDALVYADKNLIWIVLNNLISNASKYSSKKDNPIVDIRISEDDQNSIIHVKDNGIGFDMKYVENLFGVFERLSNSEEYSGTGIGLATVKRIIARHKGHIEVSGKTGEGAEFTIFLRKKEVADVREQKDTVS